MRPQRVWHLAGPGHLHRELDVHRLQRDRCRGRAPSRAGSRSRGSRRRTPGRGARPCPRACPRRRSRRRSWRWRRGGRPPSGSARCRSSTGCSPTRRAARCRASRRPLRSRSRTSPTNLAPLASAAGPRKSGSAAIELHSETQHPHWMHSASFMIRSSSSCCTRHSLTGGWSSSSSHGLTARNLAQNGSMSTTRSFTTGRLPIGRDHRHAALARAAPSASCRPAPRRRPCACRTIRTRPSGSSCGR